MYLHFASDIATLIKALGYSSIDCRFLGPLFSPQLMFVPLEEDR